MEPVKKALHREDTAYAVNIRISPERFLWFKNNDINASATIRQLLDKEYPLTTSEHEKGA